MRMAELLKCFLLIRGVTRCEKGHSIRVTWIILRVLVPIRHGALVGAMTSLLSRSLEPFPRFRLSKRLLDGDDESADNEDSL